MLVNIYGTFIEKMTKHQKQPISIHVAYNIEVIYTGMLAFNHLGETQFGVTKGCLANIDSGSNEQSRQAS